jgi:UDPglucose 6-dehydrogenase
MGGEYEYTKQLKRVYQQYSQCSPCKVFYMTPMEASFVKYGVNSFLASKVLWFNQFKDLVDRNDSRYSVVANAVGYDERIGKGHTKVPGFDGKKGFGGSCFPKDTSAIANFAGGSLTVLEEVIEANNLYRSQYMLDDREKEQNVSFNSTI